MISQLFNTVKMVLFIMVLIHYLGGTNVVLASDTIVEPIPKNSIGLSFGFLPGTGITYRRYLGDNFIQGTFIALIEYTEPELVGAAQDDVYELVDFGVVYGSYLRTIDSKSFATTAVKWLAGLEFVHDLSKTSSVCSYYDNCQYGSTLKTRTEENLILMGAGLGIDFGNIRKSGYLLTGELNYFVSYDFSRDRVAIGPSIGIGLLYNY